MKATTLACAALAISLITAREVPAQTPCNPKELVLFAVGGASGDLKNEVKKSPDEFVVEISQDIYTIGIDPKSSNFKVALRGETLTVSDLKSVKIRLPGFSFKQNNPSVKPSSGNCVASLAFEPSRRWKLRVEVPQSEMIEFQVGQGTQKVRTPRDVPGEPLDWATPIALDLYPVPTDPSRHYPYQLKASEFSQQPKCGAETGVLCHTKEEIRQKLLDQVEISGKTLVGKELARIKAERAIKELQVVSRIEFRLVRP